MIYPSKIIKGEQLTSYIAHSGKLVSKENLFKTQKNSNIEIKS